MKGLNILLKTKHIECRYASQPDKMPHLKTAHVSVQFEPHLGAKVDVALHVLLGNDADAQKLSKFRLLLKLCSSLSKDRRETA